MAYEYGSSAQRLDFPNPYRVENVFRMAAAVILVCGGLYALFVARTGLSAHLEGWSLAPIISRCMAGQFTPLAVCYKCLVSLLP